MKTANIAEFKKHLSSYVNCVEAGETVQICKRNVVVALLKSAWTPPPNKTKLGAGAGSVIIEGDLTEPAMHAGDWNMLQGTP